MTKGTIRNSALDGLRGWGAIVVVFSHAVLMDYHTESVVWPLSLGEVWAAGSRWEFLSRLFLAVANGQGAVLAFFVLSGFVLRISLDSTRQVSSLAGITTD